MRTPMRAALRLALAGWLGLAGLSLVAAQGRAATPPEKILPESTIAYLKVNNAAALRESFRQSQLGQLWDDPGLKAWKEDLAERVDESSRSLKKKLGVTYRELFEMPLGTASIAVVQRDDPKLPLSLVMTADAGKNAARMAEVLTRATEQSQDEGAKVSSELFKNVTLHVIQPPPRPKEDKEKDKDDKEKDKDKAKDKGDQPEPPVIWAQEGTMFLVASDLDLVKDLLVHSQGRDDSLAGNESFVRLQKKLGPETQVVWFVDLAKLLKLGARSNAKGNEAQVQQTEQMLQLLGFNGLKAAAGSFVLNLGNFDSVSKTIVLAPTPVQGALRIFSLPKVHLRPEAWVPATVASYQTYSWDLDNAYNAINDTLNLFQPGMINVLEQQLVGPNGGEPLSFKKDIFDPIGDRVTLISDFKKPISEENQRMLLSVALEDSKKFQNTLNKLVAVTGGTPKKREFQGLTIYDFEIPEVPNNNPNAPGGNVKFKGPISVTIAKDTLFLANEPTLLEQVLRGGGPALADSGSYQTVAKEIPDRVSMLSFVRPEEQARISYDMVKSGQFEKALENAAVAGGPDISKLSKLFDKEKLPDFSIFAKYLSLGGGYGVTDDDGLTWT
ncbi:MAG: hypothetical protein JO355_11970, partial [Planctomycetaceae bacterium]|nr:hypothetical protein [Planctomycetaceae bacterium]